MTAKEQSILSDIFHCCLHFFQASSNLVHHINHAIPLSTFHDHFRDMIKTIDSIKKPASPLFLYNPVWCKIAVDVRTSVLPRTLKLSFHLIYSCVNKLVFLW
jgi:hypothetical protein